MITTLAALATLITASLVTASGCGSPAPRPAVEQRAETGVQQIIPTQVNQSEDTMPTQQTDTAILPHPYVGMWVTADGRIRQALLPNGRYDEARGAMQSAYVGRYEVTGNRIFYWDDSGFTADGEFVDINTLHHAGMIMYREE